MNVLHMDPGEATVRLSQQEVFTLLYFVMVARDELECATTEGKAIDHAFRLMAAEFSRGGLGAKITEFAPQTQHALQVGM